MCKQALNVVLMSDTFLSCVDFFLLPNGDYGCASLMLTVRHDWRPWREAACLIRHWHGDGQDREKRMAVRVCNNEDVCLL